MSSNSQREHLPELDGFRAFSILLVLAAHMLPLGPKSWQLNLASGYMGMSLFFALSGFLITRFLWNDQNVGIFFLRRLSRIAPLVLLVSFVYCILLAGRPASFLAANLHVITYVDAALIPEISPFWSLGVEMHFYVMIGLSVLVFGRRGFFLVPIVALIVLYLRVDTQAYGNIRTHLRIDEILSGSLLAMFWVNRERPGFAKVFAFLPKVFWPSLLLWLLACLPATYTFGLAYFRAYFAALLIGTVLAMSGRWQNRLLSTATLTYIATISFALYVWHSPFRHGWFDSGTIYERYLFKRPLAFLCIFAISHASTFYFEKPITDAVRKWTSKSRRTARQ